MATLGIASSPDYEWEITFFPTSTYSASKIKAEMAKIGREIEYHYHKHFETPVHEDSKSISYEVAITSHLAMDKVDSLITRVGNKSNKSKGFLRE